MTSTGTSVVRQFASALIGLPTESAYRTAPIRYGWWYEFAGALFGHPVIRSTMLDSPDSPPSMDEIERSRAVHEGAPARSDGSLAGLIESLRAVSPLDRLELRTHSRVSEDQVGECGCVTLRRLIRAQVEGEVQRIAEVVRGAGPQAPESILDILGSIENELLESNEAPFYGLLGRLRRLLTGLATSVESESSRAMARAGRLALDLLDMIRQLQLRMDNFVGDDLSGVDILRHDLVGLIWSDETQWPIGGSEAVRSISDELYDGIYQIGRRGHGS